MTLQQRTIKWTEEFLYKRDLIQRKQTTLRNLQSTIVPPRSEMPKFELGASGMVKEVHDLEFNQLCTIVNYSKQKVGHIFKRLITKVADWETVIIKYTLIKETLQAMLKFSKPLINSHIIKQIQTSEDLGLINTKSHHASTIITEEIIINDTMNLANCTQTNRVDLLRVCRN